jgi:hypothetical protein
MRNICIPRIPRCSTKSAADMLKGYVGRYGSLAQQFSGYRRCLTPHMVQYGLSEAVQSPILGGNVQQT